MVIAATSYLARLKARASEQVHSSNPQKVQKPQTTPFEPFEGGLGERFSGPDSLPSVVPPAVAPQFPNAPKDASRPAGINKGNEWAERPDHASAKSAIETWEERAAHLEYDAGLPREWAEHFAKLLAGPVPGDFSPTRWQAALDGALMFADRWAGEAHRLGWDASEVFGLDDIAPAARIDRRGLAWLLGDGSQVVAMDRGGAEIRTRGGGRQRFYRVPDRLRS